MLLILQNHIIGKLEIKYIFATSLKRNKRYKPMNRILVFIMLISSLSYCLAQEKTDTSPDEFKKFTTFGFHVLDHSGIWGGAIPMYPDGESPVSQNYSAFGYGLNINYNFSKSVSVFFDGTIFSRKTPGAYQGGYGTSLWVFEMNQYNTNLIGPFSDDAYYFVNGTGLRLGIKGYLSRKKIQPWFGLSYGFYSWNVGYYTEDKKKTWGSAGGTMGNLHYMNFGVDIISRDLGIGATIFFDFGSPVTKFKIDDLFNDGWNYNSQEGIHLMGYNRIGISLMFINKPKNKI